MNQDQINDLHNASYSNFIQGNFHTAREIYDQILSYDPSQSNIWCNRGACLHKLRQYEDALTSYEHALAISPSNVNAGNFAGIVLIDMNRYREAIFYLDRLIAIDPNHADAYCNRGVAKLEMNLHQEAIVDFTCAIELDSMHGQAHWNKSLALLATGNYRDGWEEHKWRWETDMFRGKRRQFEKSVWTGHESIAGKTILLHAEQGLGDTIQFCRFAKHVEALGANVLLDVQPSLRSLLTTLGTGRVIDGDPVPYFDYHCSLIDLPSVLQLVNEKMFYPTCYLAADVHKVTVWNAKLGVKKRLRVGVCWSGNQQHPGDKFRSLALRDVRKLFALDADFICIQSEIRQEDEKEISSIKNLSYFGSQLLDFSETAALIATVDLVITVDTSVAHLAGSMGKQTWIMLPYHADWRWQADRTDSCWYSSVSVFRQTTLGDWSLPIRDITNKSLDSQRKHSV